MVKSQNKKIKAFLSSKWSFRAVLLLFIAETSWLALKSSFPMAFDETYHFHLIQFFSHRLNPIVTSQGANTYTMGSIVHNPSFLYHYLLSFPYRCIAHFTTSLRIQVTSLRFINIAFAVGTLCITRATLLRLKIPKLLCNIVVLAFALTPIVTALSAQVNYDNLFILLASITIYQTISFIQQLDLGIFNLKLLVGLFTVCLFASLVKYSFLPLFVGMVIVLSYKLIAHWKRDKSAFLYAIKTSYFKISNRAKVGLLLAGLIGLSMFVNFYGVNLVKYHNPVPQCNQILSIQDCKQYYSWDRNYTVAQYAKTHPVFNRMNVFQYTSFWIKVEYYQLFAEIIPGGGLVSISRLFYVTILMLSAVAGGLTIVSIPKIFRQYKALPIISVIALTYLIFLWSRNYSEYLRLQQPLAIQGRYLVPILLYVYALFGLGIIAVAESKRSVKVYLQPAIGLITVFAFIYFGGYVRYASNISPSKQWPQTQTVAIVDHNAVKNPAKSPNL
jgi:hypothetical protein